MDGTARRSVAPFLTMPRSDWRIVATGDFNADGKVDLVWRNVATTSTAIWLMDGPAFLGVRSLDPAIPWTDWRVAGAGDFDGDGQTDVIWHDTSNGGTAVWLLDGTTMRTYSSPAPSDTASRVGAVADFNGDGKADVVWRNTTTGRTRSTPPGAASPAAGAAARGSVGPRR